MAIANHLWMLFFARIIGGLLSAANMPTTMAYAADITTPENRSKGMGMIGAAVGLGFIFGPAIGGVFSDIRLNLPFTIAGSVSIFTFLLVLFVLKESKPKEERNTEKILLLYQGGLHFVELIRYCSSCNFSFLCHLPVWKRHTLILSLIRRG